MAKSRRPPPWADQRLLLSPSELAEDLPWGGSSRELIDRVYDRGQMAPFHAVQLLPVKTRGLPPRALLESECPGLCRTVLELTALLWHAQSLALPPAGFVEIAGYKSCDSWHDFVCDFTRDLLLWILGWGDMVGGLGPVVEMSDVLCADNRALVNELFLRLGYEHRVWRAATGDGVAAVTWISLSPKEIGAKCGVRAPCWRVLKPQLARLGAIRFVTRKRYDVDESKLPRY